MRLSLISIFAVLGLAACDKPAPPAAPAAATAMIVTGDAPPLRQTEAVASLEDAADDPAIWRNAANPAASLIVATDKKAGLYVYDLQGKTRSSQPAGRVNNVDLRGDVTIAGAPGVIVGASDRTDVADGKIALFALDTAQAKLTPLASLSTFKGEAYGFCFWRRAADKALFAFLIMKDGTIVQAQIDLAGPKPTLKVVRTAKLATQSEGCVADDRTGMLYVAEEDTGVWRLEADPASKKAPEAFAKVDGRTLFADTEGVALAPQGDKDGLLFVSSQGDSAYAAFRLSDGGFAGRFRIVREGVIGGTTETDGIEVALGDFGPDFPEGLMIAQDGDNAPFAQNFKLVTWANVKKALNLP